MGERLIRSDVPGKNVAAAQGVTVPDLMARTGEVADMYAADPTRCDICEDKLSDAAVTAGRDTCGSDACRKAKSRARQRGGAL